MIELRDVSVSFGGMPALQDVTLRVRPAATTVLIGPSGSGKSTVLRLMIGLVRPEAGQVLFRGEGLLAADLNEVRRRMGFVIQEGGLFPHLTARANVSVVARYLAWSTAAVETRLEELCALCRLPVAALDRYPGQLSGGERQRVSLMRALMLDPDLLLLDEPLGALDPLIRADLQGDLKLIFETLQKTVVLVTHDMGEAIYFGDRVVLLHRGRIVQEGPPREMVKSPADPFVTRFINAQRTLARELEREEP